MDNENTTRETIRFSRTVTILTIGLGENIITGFDQLENSEIFLIDLKLQGFWDHDQIYK